MAFLFSIVNLAPARQFITRSCNRKNIGLVPSLHINFYFCPSTSQWTTPLVCHLRSRISTGTSHPAKFNIAIRSRSYIHLCIRSDGKHFIFIRADTSTRKFVMQLTKIVPRAFVSYKFLAVGFIIFSSAGTIRVSRILF